MFFFSWNKEEKKQRRNKISGRPPAEAFRKTTNIQILQLLKVMFHSQLLLNFLSDWESEVVKSFISKSDRKKSNLKKKKKNRTMQSRIRANGSAIIINRL